MIVKKHIFLTLRSLDKRYNSALTSATPEDAIFYSKLAILEYCGWIEEAFDTVIRRSMKKKLKTLAFKQILEGGVIGTTYGFRYKKHLRNMLCRSLGLQRAEAIEQSLKDNGEFEVLESELETFTGHRNNAAHTSVAGTTQTYPAPSVVIASLQKVHPIARRLYKEVMD